MDVSSEGEAITGEESSGEVKKEHSVLINLIKKKRARKLEEKAKEEAAAKDKDVSNKPPPEAENLESKKKVPKRGRVQAIWICVNNAHQTQSMCKTCMISGISFMRAKVWSTSY